MWARLSDPGLANNFVDLGDAFIHMRLLLEQLGQQSYANDLFASTSHALISITTAPSFEDAASHDEVGIKYNPNTNLFEVSYGMWISATRNPSHHFSSSHTCELAEVADVVDRYVLRLMVSRQMQSKPDSN